MIYWWLTQLIINETQEKKSKAWDYYIDYFYEYSRKDFSFKTMSLLDKFIFIFFYNPGGFYFVNVEKKELWEFLLNRASNYNFLYKIFLTPYFKSTQYNIVGLSLKDFVRDYKILKKYKHFGVLKIAKSFFSDNFLLNLLCLYLIIYKRYSPIYYYLSSSLFEGIKGIDWSLNNNYHIIFIFLSKYISKANITYVDTSKLKGYFYINARFEDFAHRFKKTPQIGDKISTLYFKKLLKMKNAYIKLYKPHFNFKLFSRGVQNSTVLKHDINTYARVDSSWKSILKKLLIVRFGESSVIKYINFSDIKNYSIFYIRKNKIFNKGRYSRNRQLYRTGVYWCLWLNIMIVYGLYFYFYRFTFNFGYMWWGLGFFIFSFIFSRAVQNNFYSIKTLTAEFVKTCIWLILLINNFFNLFLKITLLAHKYAISYFYTNWYVFNSFNDYVWSRVFRSLNWFSLDFGPKHHQRFAYVWEYLAEKDTSFLRYKTILHWFKQVWKMLTTY